jgi:hypothetical protein
LHSAQTIIGFQCVLMGAMLVIVALVAYFAWLSAEARRKAWAAFAESLGMSYSRDDPFDTVRTWRHPIFGHGHSRRVANVMSGEYRGHAMRCFDYRYTVGSGKNSHTYHYTLVALIPPVPFKPIVIRPEGLGDRLAAMVGMNDIDFESQEFSDRYCVQCADGRFAYDILHARAIEYLLAQRNLAIEGDPVAVLFRPASAGHLAIPDGVRGMLDVGSGFLDLVPEYMRGDSGRD